jgi:hypothetical protein
MIDQRIMRIKESEEFATPHHRCDAIEAIASILVNLQDETIRELGLTAAEMVYLHRMMLDLQRHTPTFLVRESSS